MTSETTEIVLYQAPPALGLSSPSPFCVKVETWLQLAELRYRVKHAPDPRKGPRGKIPWIAIGEERLSDSEIIIDALASRHPELPEALRTVTPEQLLLQRTLEEHLYWTIVYSRWIDDAGFETIRQPIFAGLPALLRPLLVPVARRSVRKQLWQQGIGRFQRGQVLEKAERDVAAIAVALKDRPYFAGETPGRVDAAAYGILNSLIDPTAPSFVTGAAEPYPQLAAYTARMRSVFGDHA